MPVLSWTEVAEEDDDMLFRLKKPQLRQDFLDYLESSTSSILDIVSYHLQLHRDERCIVAPRSEWLYGSFNVCVPISVGQKRYILRCPLPLMAKPDNGVDHSHSLVEKLRCEAATYVWLSAHCENVPIPRLWGFGLPDGLRFTPVVRSSWYARTIEYCKNLWARLCHRERCVPFVPFQTDSSLKSGYLLIDFVERGKMLSSTNWLSCSPAQKHNLYSSLASIMVDMSRHPLPKIGAFTVLDCGAMCLSNRPLTKHIALLEREGISSGMLEGDTYQSTDTYVDVLLRCLDQKLSMQPNSVRDAEDAEAQMAAHTTLRAIKSEFVQDEYRTGPFIMTLTDLHQSNFFVNEEYQVVSVIDLEWCCALPIELQRPPFWLTGRRVDQFGQKQHLSLLYAEWDMFMEIYRQHEEAHSLSGRRSLHDIMQKSRSRSIHWYIVCLMVPRATYNTFLEHIQSLFSQQHVDIDEQAISFQQITAKYWCIGTDDFVKRKLKDRQQYLDQLRPVYDAYRPSSLRLS